MFIDYCHLSFAEGKKLEDVKSYNKFGERQFAGGICLYGCINKAVKPFVTFYLETAFHEKARE